MNIVKETPAETVQSKVANVTIEDENGNKVKFLFEVENDGLKMSADFGKDGAEKINGVAGFVTEQFIELIKTLSK